MVTWIFIGLFACIFLITSVFSAITGSISSHSSVNAKSTIVREKLDSGEAWKSDCVVDEMGWLKSEKNTASELKEFWEDTGVQPYIYLKDYDAALATEGDREEWCAEYYDANFNREDVFMFVYFAADQQDAYNQEGVGNYYYYYGDDVATVMDDEAVDILLNYLNANWDNLDLTWDQVFYEAFQSTGNAIMHVSTTGKDLVKWFLAAAAAAAAGITGVSLVKQRNKRKKEEAEENERILNTPIDDMIKDEAEKKADDLTEKYLKEDM